MIIETFVAPCNYSLSCEFTVFGLWNQGPRLEPAIEIMFWRDSTLLWGKVPCRDTLGLGGCEQGAKQAQETGLLAGRHSIVAVQERWASSCLWRWTRRHRLQPLVPSRIARHLEWATLRNSIRLKTRNNGGGGQQKEAKQNVCLFSFLERSSLNLTLGSSVIL